MSAVLVGLASAAVATILIGVIALVVPRYKDSKMFNRGTHRNCGGKWVPYYKNYGGLIGWECSSCRGTITTEHQKVS